jgi:glycosyltransferase involved in cell wall biosynthesis
MNEVPKISIITVVFNGESLIERTIKSVLSQSYSNIEYIIIDGASRDNTLSVVERYKSKITKIISEKDKCIYDAMNKGLQAATADYVLFLNAGDEIYANDTLEKVFETSNDGDVYYGNTIVTNIRGEKLGDRRLVPPLHLNWKSLKYGMCVSHQSFIAKRILCSFYNLDYTISADIDWVINVLKESKKIVNTQIYISKYLEGGASNKNRIKALIQRFNIMVKQYGFFQTIWNHIYILLRYPIHRLTRKSMS